MKVPISSHLCNYMHLFGKKVNAKADVFLDLAQIGASYISWRCLQVEVNAIFMLIAWTNEYSNIFSGVLSSWRFADTFMIPWLP